MLLITSDDTLRVSCKGRCLCVFKYFHEIKSPFQCLHWSNYHLKHLLVGHTLTLAIFIDCQGNMATSIMCYISFVSDSRDSQTP